MEKEILHIGSRRPRIAMVSTHGYVSAHPPLGAADTGGQVVYVLELSKKLALQGFEVDIWTRRFEDQPEVELVSERTRIIRAPSGGRQFIPKEYLFETLGEWGDNALTFIRDRRLSYRFVDSHYWDGGIAGGILSSAAGVPHVHTPHSLGIWKMRQMEADFPGDAARFEKEYNFQARIHNEGRIYVKADAVVATTHLQRQLLSNEYGVPAEKCPVIPAGYDEARFFPVSRARRQEIRRRLGWRGFVVLVIGRLARNKGYDLLLPAFRRASVHAPEARLVLAIGGKSLNPEEQKILDSLKKLAAELRLGAKVQFESFIPDPDLADTYRAADTFVLCSRYEPFGMTAVEAMACGTPTIVSIHGGLARDLESGRHALHADPFNEEDLGSALRRLMVEPFLRARLSRRGARLVRSQFTWERVAQRLVKVAAGQTARGRSRRAGTDGESHGGN